MRILSVFAAVWVCLAGGAAAETLSGAVAWPGAAALPPGAVVRITLSDVSLADAPAPVLAETMVQTGGPPPLDFVLSYDARLIDPRNVYAVRATVSLDGRLLFTTDTTYPVLTRGAPDRAALVLVPAGG